MHFHARVKRVDFALVQVEVRGVEVAEVQCAGAMTRKLVGAGATDSNERVCACDDDDFTLDPSVIISTRYRLCGRMIVLVSKVPGYAADAGLALERWWFRERL